MPHIVVIEDDPLTQKIMSQALRKMGGFEVTVTESVLETFTLMRSRHVDLVVMDVGLANTQYKDERIDGVIFARLLKSDPTTNAVPILLATAFAGPGDSERLLHDAGADGYIAKPFAEPRSLVNKVQQMLAESTAKAGQ